MKVGDKLYCYCSILSNLTVGKVYVVNNIDSLRFNIENDIGNRYYFFHNNEYFNSEYWYEKVFYNIRKIRKLKLDELKRRYEGR